MKKVLLFLGLSCMFFGAIGQQVYLISFDEKEQEFDPYAWFDPHAIQRKLNKGLPIFDEKDLPIKPSYLAKISQKVHNLRHSLRWFNAVSVEAYPEQLEEIAAYNWVIGIEELCPSLIPASIQSPFEVRDDTLLQMVRQQLELDSLAAAGLSGKGVRMAIFDVGFKELPSHPSTRHLWKEGQIIRTKDFYQADSGVYHHDMHGTQVLACVAGRYKGRELGAGRDVKFMLARTEHKIKEKPIEEDHWLAAMQWADRHGADIIQSSLGYTDKRYTYEEMDGRSTLVSRAAKMAADKGILVIVSNGNEGADKWRYLGAPADVPEVLSVGSSFPFLKRKMPYSSYGPNAMKQTKPDVVAPGFVIGPGKRGTYDEIAGTSFATPLVAGMAACLLEKNPSLRPNEVIDMFHQLGHLYPYYDYAMGYGVPQATRMLTKHVLVDTLSAFSIEHKGDTLFLYPSQDMIEDSLQYPFGVPFHIHVEDSTGFLTLYSTSVIEKESPSAGLIKIPRDYGLKGMLRIWFGGDLFEEKWD
ncbi:MAG: S8 family serine peptidase [Bacteroidota bacterium]